MESNQILLRKIVSLPRFLNYAIDPRGIEIRPGQFSPIYLNLKSLWSYPKVFLQVVKEIKKICSGYECIVGIETGGSPYASLVAKELNAPFMLVRKETKGFYGYLAGYSDRGASFAIIDDVIATGTSLRTAIDCLKTSNEIKLVSVFSYGMDDYIFEKYGFRVHSLYQVDDILSAVSPELSMVLSPLIDSYKDKLRRKISNEGNHLDIGLRQPIYALD